MRGRAALLALAVCAVYARTWNFDYLGYDDPAFVTRNPVVSQGLTPDGLRYAMSAVVAANWHPLTLLSHMLDVELFGLAPGPAHGVNALLHVLNALLVYIWLSRATGRAEPSFAIAALFALHPIQVESVAWISQRKTLLAAGFCLGASIAWQGYAREACRRCYVAALALFAAALACKPTAVALPLVWLLLDAWPLARWRRSADLPPLVAEKGPCFALAAALALLTFELQSQSGAVAADHGVALSARVAGAALGVAGTLAHLVWPSGLAVHYPHPYVAVAGGVAPPAWQPLLVGALIAAATLAAWRARATPAGFGWLAFLALVAPSAGVVQVGTQAYADRYAYLPSVGVFVALVFPIAAWAEGVAARERALARARVAVGVVLALLSFHQLRYWYASEPLYLRATQISPRDVAMQYNLGNAYLARKHYAAAIGAYQAALAVDPKLVPAHVNLGIAYQEIEMIPNAIAELERAIQLHPRDAAAQLALGNSFLRDGRIDEAIARYERALELEPGAPLVLRALDVARARLAGAAEP